jgi:hypothetical protein
LDELNLGAPQSRTRFRRDRIPLSSSGAFAWGAIGGVRAGTLDQAGSFYRVVYRLDSGAWRHHLDPMAVSLPFGAFAPAELYDIRGLLARRKDAAYFDQIQTVIDADGVRRMRGPINILQIHVHTASEEGTFAGLTALYRRIAEKVRRGHSLTAAEQNYVGYDAVQLMPIEPVIEYEDGPPFWQTIRESDDEIEVQLRRPDMTNWGYDVVIAGSPAINPTTLATGRPDEFLEFIEVLHTFPEKPIAVVLDVVYGHADNQALQILDDPYFAGSNMYGQNLNYKHPVVRAILLEMQRRKGNYGVDGIRVDGAQDFKVWDAEAETMRHDDDFLRLVNDIELDVLGKTYRPWMIFEDGRPWPQEDWELASTYREVTKQLPNVVQWGPLTFAHNTPFLVTFWISKWWRIRQVAAFGRDWITGCANHDTLRRGTQAAPDARINVRLGRSLPEILRRAYDNPSARLFDYALMPGIPMDFINANMRAPWSFVRNTDVRFAVKVVSEEARFLAWAVTEGDFQQHFRRLRQLGFSDLGELQRFIDALAQFVSAAANELEQVAHLMSRLEPPLSGPELSPTSLVAFARDWMDDVHDYCNVWRHTSRLDARQTSFDLALRGFRRQRPWLVENMTVRDQFDYLRPLDGAVVFFGLRHAPENKEELLFIANMEGATQSLSPLSLPLTGLSENGWEPILVTPGLDGAPVNGRLKLADSQGIVYTRRPG